jgi:hypothetical protein
MKPLMQFGLCCLLAPGLFAEHHGGGTPGHSASHVHGSIQNFGSGHRGGYLYGGFYSPFYDYGYSPAGDTGASNTTVVYPPAPPPVMMVMETAHPVIHEYGQPEDYGTTAEHGNDPILYLIAFRDSTIRAATTYWVEGGTLHYLDTGHKAKEAPLSSVDPELSGRLNRERHIPFNIQ